MGLWQPGGSSTLYHGFTLRQVEKCYIYVQIFYNVSEQQGWLNTSLGQKTSRMLVDKEWGLDRTYSLNKGINRVRSIIWKGEQPYKALQGKAHNWVQFGSLYLCDLKFLAQVLGSQDEICTPAIWPGGGLTAKCQGRSDSCAGEQHCHDGLQHAL